MQSLRPVIRVCSTYALQRPARRLLPRHVSFSWRRAIHASAQTYLPRRKKKETPKTDEGEVRFFEQDNEGGTPLQVDSLGGNPLMEQLEREMQSDLEELDKGERLLNHESHPFKGFDDSEGLYDARDDASDLLKNNDSSPTHGSNIPNLAPEDIEMADILPHQISSERPLPRQSAICLDQFNITINESLLNPNNQKCRNQVWVWYERSKLNVPGLIQTIPKDAWDTLWSIQDSHTSPERGPRLARLANDKAAAGWDLTQSERFRQIEGLFLSGRQQEALDKWESARADKASMKDKDFLELGLRMHTRAGTQHRVSSILEEIQEGFPNSDPRLMQPVIAMYIKDNTQESIARAWVLYDRMRMRLASNMAMEDYDAVVLAFLSVGQKDSALAVFRDMMLCKNRVVGQDPSYRNALDRIMNFLSSRQSATEINELSLQAILYLPRRYQNKFFYASWLRKLISEGLNDEASQVIELMYERQVRPDAKHMNGLISGWFRKGTAADSKRAEELGWAMIQQRLDFVQRRNQQASDHEVPHTSIHKSKEDVRIPPFVNRPVPNGTIETFCILLQHCLKHGMYAHARHLRNLLVPAEIRMNAYFMNHLLRAELYVRGYSRAWNRFQIMCQEVRPDMDTWACLWECMKKHVEATQNNDPTGFPRPRELFRSWTQWFRGLQGSALTSALQRLDPETYHEVLRSFCLSKDIAGCFVGMHAMHQMFGICPQEATTRLVVTSIARLTMNTNAPSLRQRRGRKTNQSQKNAASVERLFDAIWEQRLEYMSTNGIEYESLDDDDQAEENHRTLLSLLFTISKRQDSTLEAFTTATNDMGVEPFNADDAIALAV